MFELIILPDRYILPLTSTQKTELETTLKERNVSFELRPYILRGLWSYEGMIHHLSRL